MSEGDCNLACQTKIILNGGNIATISSTTYRALDNFVSQGGTFTDGKKLIKLLNEIENKVVEAQSLAAKCMGYDGPVGKMLETPPES